MIILSTQLVAYLTTPTYLLFTMHYPKFSVQLL